jgi:hypothetical protein
MPELKDKEKSYPYLIFSALINFGDKKAILIVVLG